MTIGKYVSKFEDLFKKKKKNWGPNLLIKNTIMDLFAKPMWLWVALLETKWWFAHKNIIE